MSEAPQEVRDLADRRALAREAKDYAQADSLREQIAAAGWEVLDEPGGWRLEEIAVSGPSSSGPIDASQVESLLELEPTEDLSLHWVAEGWPQDIARAVAAFRAQQGTRRVQYVVADVTGADPQAFGPDVQVLSLEAGTGWGSALNAGLKRSTARTVFIMDGSIEPTGDVFSPLEVALGDPSVGVCGPFGIVTKDLREFEQAPGPGDCDAIEGYFMALRRETLLKAGLFDEKFRWYRTADIEFSFRVKDRGLRVVGVPVPVIKHDHRMWFETLPESRAKWSKRNYYRFLDLWRDRWDLCVAPEPPEHHHGHDH